MEVDEGSFMAYCREGNGNGMLVLQGSRVACKLSVILMFDTPFEPAYEIMALFVLRIFVLQIRVRSHPVVLDVGFFLSDHLSTSIVHVCEQRRLW